MDLKSPATLALAWLVVPGLVTATCAGLGAGLGRLAGLSLGALTVPMGFLIGVLLMVLPLQIGLGALPAVLLCVACAVAGAAMSLRGRASAPRAAFPGKRELPAWLAPTLAGLVAFGIGMAPLVGSGRSGVLGYTLNNDPSVHLSAIELLRDSGASVLDGNVSSYAFVSGVFSAGYPLGSHVWPLFGAVLTGMESFHVWSPTIALYVGFLALVTYALLREMDAPRVLAGVGGALAAVGYLPFSYLAQGGAKEVAVTLAIYATLALFVCGVRQAGLSFRGLVPAALGSAASVATFGLAALAWLGPAALIACAVLAWRTAARGRIGRAALGVGAAAALAAVAALPSIIDSVAFAREFADEIENPAQTGNLVGAVPVREALNVWLAYDYRLPTPDKQLATNVGLVLAAGLAVIGLAYAIIRRRWAVPLAVLAAVCGVIIILTRRYAVYFDAKAYVVLAPALGLAAATGVLALLRAGPLWRVVGLLAGLIVAVGVIASDAMVYAGVWVTPKDRFNELIELGERYRGQGPMLVNDREDYAKLFLRDSMPWESWGAWQSNRGFRFGPVPPAPPRTPDFDDYTLDYMKNFELLVQRRRPLGSAPPSNYRLVEETRHYQVWRRDGPFPAEHVSVGIDLLSGAATLDCSVPEVASLMDTARHERRSILVSWGSLEPPSSGADSWQQYGGYFVPGPTPGFATRRGGVALPFVRVPPGEYTAWIQGGFGPGVQLMLGVGSIGEAFGDLGLHSGWHRLGDVRVKRPDPPFAMVGVRKPWWQSGSKRTDTTGPLVFVPKRDRVRVDQVPPRQLGSLCGKTVDWLELPASGGRS